MYVRPVLWWCSGGLDLSPIVGLLACHVVPAKKLSQLITSYDGVHCKVDRQRWKKTRGTPSYKTLARHLAEFQTRNKIQLRINSIPSRQGLLSVNLYFIKISLSNDDFLLHH